MASQLHLVPSAHSMSARTYKSPHQHATTTEPIFLLLFVPNPCSPQESTYCQDLPPHGGTPFGQSSLLHMIWLKEYNPS